MPHYPELERMCSDMRTRSELYRPTAFWDQASRQIKAELVEHGVETFRSLQLPLGYFVPTYGSPANGFIPEQIYALRACLENGWPAATKPALALTQFLQGRMEALADYRVLLASDDQSRTPYLHEFSESVVGCPVGQWVFDGRRFSRSSLNYLLGLAFLKSYAPGFQFRTVLEVGGGFGTLGEVIVNAGIDDVRYIDIDIPPTSFIAQYYLGEVLGTLNVATYSGTKDMTEIEIKTLPQAAVLCSWQIERLAGEIDLFVNFISFQEMEPPVVRNYLDHARRLGARHILLRNLREGKQKRQPGGSVGVEIPVMGDDYAAMLPGYELIARNVFPFGYQTVDGFHSELQLLRRKL